MKKILALILALALMATFAACGNKTDDADDAVSTDIVTQGDETQMDEATDEQVADDKQNAEQTNKQDKQPNNEQPKKEQEKPSQKPAQKPADETKPQQPSQNPVEAPAQKPAEPPVEKPAENNQANATLGNILLSDFKAKAGSGMGAEDIANALLANSAIKFSGGAIPVEPGLLSGFDNAEITGFKSGYMFAPMIGSIPFVGYIFELENASDAASFIANLEKNANKRWNICVEADETVTGSAGNKVFFVMCPKTLEE